MNIFYNIFVYAVWFLSSYSIIFFILSILKNKNRLYESPDFDKDYLPKVSVVISAYNEEKKIASTIKSLSSVDYPKELLETIIVNDGSTDKTREVVLRYVHNKNLKFIDNAENKGKAACLNQGIDIAKGEFVACMDADSVVSPDVIKKTISYFKNKKIGAVTVSVRVKNPRTFLQKIIEIEYILGLSLFLRILSFFNTIHVTPGPFSIYRKSMLHKIGGFDITNITEDLEIAYRIQKTGYKIACCMNTHVNTITPPKFKSLYTQRKRWYSGALQTTFQHRDVLFKKKHGVFGFFIPFNYSLILLGMFLFLYTLYLIISNILKHISFYSLTNFNFFSHLSLKNIDFLSTSILHLFGGSAILGGVILMIVGLRTTKNSIKNRIPAFLSYILIFFLYQLFWVSSFCIFLFKKRAKWR